MKSFLCKIADLWPVTLLKAGLHHMNFQASFIELFRTATLYNSCERLLVYVFLLHKMEIK